MRLHHVVLVAAVLEAVVGPLRVFIEIEVAYRDRGVEFFGPHAVRRGGVAFLGEVRGARKQFNAPPSACHGRGISGN